MRLIVLLAIALAACGGGVSQNAASFDAAKWDTVVSQPATVPVYNDRSPPRGTVGVTRWAMRERPGDVVSADGVLDISIDSAYSLRPTLATIVMGTNLAEPISVVGRTFRQSFDLKVTRTDHSGASVAHVVSYFSICNRVTSQCRWNGLIVFDTRVGRSGTVEKWDTGTQRPIFNVVSPNYASIADGQWRSFVFSPSAPLSADDELRHGNINPELHTSPGERARIDVEIRNWKIEAHR